MELKYIHWEDYYRESFVPAYETARDAQKALELTNDALVSAFLQAMEAVFYASLKCMQYYLYNNGSFPNKLRDTIKEFFKFNLLQDGDTWIQFGDIIYSRQNLKMDVVVKFCKTNCYIFSKLNEQFESMLENNG